MIILATILIPRPLFVPHLKLDRKEPLDFRLSKKKPSVKGLSVIESVALFTVGGRYNTSPNNALARDSGALFSASHVIFRPHFSLK